MLCLHGLIGQLLDQLQKIANLIQGSLPLWIGFVQPDYPVSRLPCVELISAGKNENLEIMINLVYNI
jgi:hypothetical protein